jgi:hypothetical protein
MKERLKEALTLLLLFGVFYLWLVVGSVVQYG